MTQTSSSKDVPPANAFDALNKISAQLDAENRAATKSHQDFLSEESGDSFKQKKDFRNEESTSDFDDSCSDSAKGYDICLRTTNESLNEPNMMSKEKKRKAHNQSQSIFVYESKDLQKPAQDRKNPALSSNSKRREVDTVTDQLDQLVIIDSCSGPKD